MRKNKSKKDIVSDIQLTQAAERRRALIRDVIFPYLVDMDDSIAYSKIFLQAYAGLVEGVYEENRSKTTVGHLAKRVSERLDDIFAVSKPDQRKEKERYSRLTELLKDISIQDLAYAAEMPRFIDGYLLKDINTKSIREIPIDKILG